MPKLPILTAKDLLAILYKKGFQVDHATGSHFILRNPANLRRVTVPFHRKDLPRGTVMAILRQAGLSKDDLKQKAPRNEIF